MLNNQVGLYMGRWLQADVRAPLVALLLTLGQQFLLSSLSKIAPAGCIWQRRHEFAQHARQEWASEFSIFRIRRSAFHTNHGSFAIEPNLIIAPEN